MFGHCTLRLLSFCKVKHTIVFQKIVFPLCWAFRAEASVILPNRTHHRVSESCVSIFMGVALAIKPPAGQLLICYCDPRPAGPCMPTSLSRTMPVVHVTMRPRGLHPIEPARALNLHAEEGLSLDSVCDEVRKPDGNSKAEGHDVGVTRSCFDLVLVVCWRAN